ncbi:MAG: peptidoglycan editing factor PgeF [Microcystaceae cyanobacterium]
MVVTQTNVSPLTPSPDWQWQKWQDMPYLTCNLLKYWQHGFFTANFYPKTPESLTEILNPDAKAYRVKQVHGNLVLTPSEIQSYLEEKGVAEADGVISNGNSQSLWVAGADCTPVLIGDVYTKQGAAIHAGWRGTAKKIVPHAIKRFLESGSQIQTLRVAMGPAIAGQVYQVSKDVAAEVGKSIVSAELSTSEAILDSLEGLFESPLLPDPEADKIRLDVRRVNQIQLKQLGLSDEQIAIAPYCTYQQSELFFSYRRTHEKKVQWSGIVV